MKKHLLLFLAFALVLPSLVFLFPTTANATLTSAFPICPAQPQGFVQAWASATGVKPVPTLDENSSFVMYMRGTGNNTDTTYHLSVGGTNGNRIEISSAGTDTFGRIFANNTAMGDINYSTVTSQWETVSGTLNARSNVACIVYANNVNYNANYTFGNLPAYNFNSTPEPPEPEPEPTPVPDSEKYYVRFGQQVGFIITLMIGIYTIWILRYRK